MSSSNGKSNINWTSGWPDLKQMFKLICPPTYKLALGGQDITQMKHIWHYTELVFVVPRKFGYGEYKLRHITQLTCKSRTLPHIANSDVTTATDKDTPSGNLMPFVHIWVSSSVATATKQSGTMSHHGSVRRGQPSLTHNSLHMSAVTQNQHGCLQAVS